MKVTIDVTDKVLTVDGPGESRTVDLYSDVAFGILSDLWVKVGWNQKYSYTFSWMGRPIIQLPEDIIRIQEAIHEVRPDVIVETGVAHGGSLVLYASLFKAMGRGRVIGVDIDIRAHNRKAIEAHPLSPFITLIEGSSTAADVVSRVRGQIKPGETVLVVLDSNHTRQHVLDELDSYHGLVTPGSYIVATDGVMRDLTDVPRGQPGWSHDNPAEAAETWVRSHPEFELAPPRWPFNESTLSRSVTHWPSAWLMRK
ncbi:MAG: CmcI family methyltransferase [Verrucomicrobiota bacterium]